MVDNDPIWFGSHELIEGVDWAYEAELREAKFPVRLSSLGACQRSVAATLHHAPQRVISARSRRVFERGDDVGDHLADRCIAGMKQRILDRGLDPTRFTFNKEMEVALRTEINGEEAIEVAAACHAWQTHAGVEDPELTPLVIDSDGFLRIVGHIDLLITDSGTNSFWVIDFKTKNQWGLKQLEKDEKQGYGYLMQVNSYCRALEDEGLTRQGAFLYYEGKDEQNHVCLPVEPNEQALDEAIAANVKTLRDWQVDCPITDAPATYAHPKHWTKARHVGKAGCLPWNCNYCNVGPIEGKCLDSQFSVEDVRYTGRDIPHWQVTNHQVEEDVPL